MKTYKEYTDKFISVLKPDILCFDSYPTFGDCGAGVDVEGSGAFFKNGMNYSRDTRDHFLYNLQYIGKWWPAVLCSWFCLVDTATNPTNSAKPRISTRRNKHTQHSTP